MNLSDLCESASELAHYWPYKAILGAKLFLCLLAITSLYFVIKDVGTRWLVHPNAKILFSHHLFWSGFLPVMYIPIWGYEVFRLSVHHENPCEYLLSVKFSLNFRIWIFIGAVSQNCSILMLAIERMISTLMLERYEKVTSPVLGIMLTVVSNLLSIGLTYGMTYLPYLGTDMMSSMSPTFSHRNTFNADGCQSLSDLQIGCELLGLVLFHWALYYSQRMITRRTRVKTQSVAHTYQLTENRNVIRPLLPIFWVHFAVFFVQAVGLGTFSYWFPGGSARTFQMYLEILVQLPLYTVILGLMLHPRTSRRRKPSITRVTNVTPATDEYFRTLKNMFEKGV